MKVKGRYDNDEFIKEFSEAIFEHMNEDTVIFNIGTDRCIGDSIGPLVGNMLIESGFRFPVSGTTKHPNHALTLEKRFNELIMKHPNPSVIAIDACLGDKKCIGELNFSDTPIKPGAGVGKTLPHIGDYSIKAIVDDLELDVIFTNRQIRLDFVLDMAKAITNALLAAEKKYFELHSEVASSF